MNKKALNFRAQPGYSLVFAFLIMTIIMIVASTTISNTTGKIRYFNELEGASQARLAAESAADLAIVAIKDYQAGYEPFDSEAFCLDFDGDGECEASGSYEVIATGQENAEDGTGEFYIPIPGTGTAAPTSECTFDLDRPESIDHPCNWNKILYGESVVVPMYADDGDSDPTDGETFNLSELGMTTDGWQLRLRTPCFDGSYDDDCERYEFYAGYTDTSGDDTIVDVEDPSILGWQVSGENSSGSFTLIPNDALDLTSPKDRNLLANTEIYELLINDGDYFGDYLVMDVNSSSTIYSELYSYSSDSTTDLMELFLSVIYELKDIDDLTIPYLEWQIVLNSDDLSISDTKSSISSEGISTSNNTKYYSNYSYSYLQSGEASSIHVLSN